MDMKTKLILIALLAAGVLSAETLVKYDTEPISKASDTALPAASTAKNITASELNFGPGTKGSNLSANNWVTFGFDQGSTAEALAANDYLSLTVSADNGFQLNLDSLELVFFVQNNDGNNPDWAVYSSADSFTAPLASGTKLTGGAYIKESVNLSHLGAVTGDLEFRIVFANTVNQYNYAGLSTDRMGSWPKPPAIALNGKVETAPVVQ